MCRFQVASVYSACYVYVLQFVQVRKNTQTSILFVAPRRLGARSLAFQQLTVKCSQLGEDPCGGGLLFLFVPVSNGNGFTEYLRKSKSKRVNVKESSREELLSREYLT